MLQPLKISDHELDSLAAGGASHSAIEKLLAGEFSRRVLQVLAILDSVHDTTPETVRSLREAYELLCQVQTADPEVVWSVLTLPCAGFWADACLRGDTGIIGYQYLASLAALAAIRAGYEAEIRVPVVGGLVCLPTAGTVTARQTIPVAVQRTGSATVLVLADGGFRITGPDGVVPVTTGSAKAPGWVPASLLRAGAPGQQLNVWLADRGPFRGPPGIALAAPLSTGQTACWQRMLARTWQIVASRHPEQAAAMTLALRTLTPMAGGSCAPDGGQDSATAMSAPGAVLLTPPYEPEVMALTLLHEFQHTKLAALEHMVVLHSGDPRPRFYAPWREDPRPLGALLHGAYAHLGVAAYWHGVVTSANGPWLGDMAEEELGYWIWAVRTAVAQLQDSDALTSTGRRFVTGMDTAASRLATLPLGSAAKQRSTQRARRHRAAWNTRHRHEALWDSVNCQAGLGRWP
jgi:HEXXH motif-containing protein